MNCTNCGASNASDAKFCCCCGKQLIVNNYNPNQTYPAYYQQPVYGFSGTGQATHKVTGVSKVLAVISLVFIVLAVLVVIGGVILSRVDIKESPVAGTWDCKSYSGSGTGDYVVTMTLDNNENFKWAKYGDENNSYVKGTYTYEYVPKSNAPENSKYYNVKFTGEEFYDEGVKQDEPYSAEYEMGLVTDQDNKRQIVMMNVATYNMFYCYER